MNKLYINFIDKIIKIDLYKKFVYSSKKFFINEYFFKNHFYKNPIVPGCIIIENMAQTASYLIYLKYNIKQNIYLSLINKIKFNFFVRPNDKLITKAFYICKKNNFIKFKIISFVNNNMLCNTNMIFKI